MSRSNPLWGAPRIHGELLKLGTEVSQVTVSKYMVRHLYYHESRTHLGPEKDCPEPRLVEPTDSGMIQVEPMVGGLHHRYYRQAV